MAAPEFSHGEDQAQTLSTKADADASYEVSLGKPAIGLLALPEVSDAIAGTILRAQRHGYETLVGYYKEDLESVRFARRLGATLFALDDVIDEADCRRRFAREARQRGYPGVVYHPDPHSRIDYEHSVETLFRTDDYLVEGVPHLDFEDHTRLMVAIPAYNEAGSIAKVVRQAEPHAEEVVVIDDGSTDDTAREARSAGAHVIRHDDNRGYGAALRTAFTAAERSSTDRLVILDGDGQHRPEDIPRLVEEFEATECDIVIGSRLVHGADTDMPAYRRIGLSVVNLLTNVSMTGIAGRLRWVRDTQSGFRLYSREAIETLSADDSIGHDMDASTDILNHAAKRDYEIAEVGATVRYDVEDANSEHPVRHGMGLVGNILTTLERERPVSFLGVPAFLALVGGLLLSHFTLAQVLSTSTVPIGFAILASMLLVSGLFLAFAATVSRTLGHYAPDDSTLGASRHR